MNNKYILFLLPDDDVLNFYQNYNQDSENSGFDLYVPQDIEFLPWETKFVDMGVKCEMIKMYEGNEDTSVNTSFLLYPRSSISKTGLILLNSVGVIDNSYRGKIIAALKYIPGIDQNSTYKVKRGDRLVQLCSPDLTPLNMTITNHLTKTNRGEGGFGSTGK